MKRTTRKKRKLSMAWVASANYLPLIRQTRAGIRGDIELYRALGCEIRGPVKVLMP